MNDKCAYPMVQISYYEFYQKIFAPSFREIDVTLKSMEKPLTIPEAAALLHLPEENIRQIMTDAALTRLDKSSFLTVMVRGGSAVCRLYQRELLRGSKARYSPADIAYIYGVSKEHVQQTCAHMGIREASATEVPEVLRRLSVFILC